jgi:hypothetical protein
VYRWTGNHGVAKASAARIVCRPGQGEKTEGEARENREALVREKVCQRGWQLHDAAVEVVEVDSKAWGERARRRPRGQDNREKDERHTENCNAIPSPMSKTAALKYMGISY